MPDYTNVPIGNLKDMIARHEKAGATNIPSYATAIEELAKRQSKSLKVDVTLSLLMKSAQKEKYISYKDVSDASGTNWSKVHWQMPGHLDSILQVCHVRNLPLLTSLCVNSGNTESGELAESSLSGFIKGARRLGYTITDEKSFLRQCQAQCFAWGKTS